MRRAPRPGGSPPPGALRAPASPRRPQSPGFRTSRRPRRRNDRCRGIAPLPAGRGVEAGTGSPGGAAPSPLQDAPARALREARVLPGQPGPCGQAPGRHPAATPGGPETGPGWPPMSPRTIRDRREGPSPRTPAIDGQGRPAPVAGGAALPQSERPRRRSRPCRPEIRGPRPRIGKTRKGSDRGGITGRAARPDRSPRAGLPRPGGTTPTTVGTRRPRQSLSRPGGDDAKSRGLSAPAEVRLCRPAAPGRDRRHMAGRVRRTAWRRDMSAGRGDACSKGPKRRQPGTVAAAPHGIIGEAGGAIDNAQRQGRPEGRRCGIGAVPARRGLVRPGSRGGAGACGGGARSFGDPPRRAARRQPQTRGAARPSRPADPASSAGRGPRTRPDLPPSVAAGRIRRSGDAPAPGAGSIPGPTRQNSISDRRARW